MDEVFKSILDLSIRLADMNKSIGDTVRIREDLDGLQNEVDHLKDAVSKLRAKGEVLEEVGQKSWEKVKFWAPWAVSALTAIVSAIATLSGSN